MIKFSPPQSTPENVGRMTRIGMTTLLVITHGAVAVATLSLLQVTADWQFLFQLMAVMIVGGALGGLLTYGVLNDLQLVETALHRLGQGLRVELLPTKHREPMRFMMEHVNTLIDRERELTSMRQQLRGQIGEATAQEERSRLARDLHDSIKQQIFSISVSAAAVQARWESDTPGAQRALADVRRSAQEAMVEMRAMLQQLAPAPLEKVGLTQALHDQCEALEYRSGAKVTCEIGDLPPDDRLPPGAQEAIFRIAQEALTNIARHARASQVQLRLSADESGVKLVISDDGQGFERATATKGMGLANMEARAQGVDARLTIESQAGKGTHLMMHVPFSLPIAAADVEVPALSTSAEKQFADSKVRLQISAVALFISLVMLFVGTLVIGRDDLEPWLYVLAAVFAVGGSAGMFYGGRALVRGLKAMRVVREEAGLDSAPMLLLRYNGWLAFTLVPLFTFIFVPTVVVGLVSSGAAIAVAALALTGVIAAFTRAFRLYHLYIQSLSHDALKRTAREDFVESTWSRYGWAWSLPMLMNLVIDFPPQFPPQRAGDWLDLSLPAAGVLFLAASVTYWRYHRNVNRRIEAGGPTS